LGFKRSVTADVFISTRFTLSSLSSATQAFAWMSFIILSVLLCLLIFYMITGSDDDSSNASSRFFSQNEIQQQQNRRAEKDFEASTSQFRKKESHFHS